MLSGLEIKFNHLNLNWRIKVKTENNSLRNLKQHQYQEIKKQLNILLILTQELFGNSKLNFKIKNDQKKLLIYSKLFVA